MEKAQENQASQQQTPPAAPQQSNAEELKVVRLQSLAQFYSSLIHYVNTLPIHPQYRANAFMNFDQGMMWIKEAITMIPAEALAPAVPANVVNELKKKHKQLNKKRKR